MEILIEIGMFLLSFVILMLVGGMFQATVIDMEKKEPAVAWFFILMYTGIVYWLFFKMFLGQ